MNKITIIICKFASIILKLMGRGSNFPGALALKINKNIINYFKMPKLVIAVTGSAGKGSTSSIIANVLEKDNKKVIYNKYGSNMLPGILSLLISNCSLNGKIKTDAVVMEVDERYTKVIFDALKPKYVVITNICRDQPPRHGNVDLVFEKINSAITNDMTLILNGDDPYLRKFDKCKNVIYYGINKNKYSYKINKFNNINISYCPICNNKLKYNYYHIESLGDYYCDKCSFKRPNINYLASIINLDMKYIIINNNKIKISFNVLYCAYNILAAYSLLSTIKIDEKKLSNYISNLENNNKLNEFINYKSKKIYVLNNKNENSTTFNQSVLFASNNKEKKIIIIGWKEISRRYKHNDMSWLYDIEFELLNNKYTEKIICLGRDKYDIATRMKYAGFKKNQIIILDSMEKLKNTLNNKNVKNIYAIVNFDYVEPIKRLFRED